MSGISSKTAGGLENKKKYQQYELNSDFDINLYESFYRSHDPQIGRFLQIDPKPNDLESPYASMNNNPILRMDILGDTTVPGAGFWSNFLGGMKDGGNETIGFFKSLGTAQGWKNLGNGILDLADRTNPTSVSGVLKNGQTGEAVVDYVSNIPNMTKDQIGHDLGYGLEKTAEAVVATKGVGMLKNALNTARATELGNTMGTLREASQGMGNFGIGEATAKSSNKLGKIWVGDNATLASDGKTLVSKDRLKQYRPPATKNSSHATTGVQSNFQSRSAPSGTWQNNGHLDITQKPWWRPW